MKTSTLLVSTTLFLAATGLQAGTAPTPETLIARGRYLVEGVGLCADCHTPRDEKGEFVMTQWLRGALIGFTPAVPMPWAPAAPPITGLPSLAAEDAVKFLMEGKRPDGTMPRPPMPAYRLNEADARAMVAYLKSIGDTPVAATTPRH